MSTLADPTTTNSVPAPTEAVFTKYTPSQATTYTQLRRNYHSSVYQYILDHHTNTGGQLSSVLDIGCGPGLATRTLATHFQHATGLDPSPGMIATAQEQGGHAISGEAITYAVSSAEALADIPNESVDLITAANAAHWFVSMPHFWRRAAEVLKPGGSVALWTSGGIQAHPSMPNGAKIQEVFDRHREEELMPFMSEGNLLVHDGYKGLKMPWDCEPVVAGFEKEEFVRKEWGLDEYSYEGQEEDVKRGGIGLGLAEKMFGTGSAVTKWREANPDKVGTDEDVVKKLMASIGELLREAGVKAGEEKVNGLSELVVLLVKKKQDA